MKWIEKVASNAPVSLLKHRQSAHSNYENYADKTDLRTALINEQGAICCYCMCRIYDNHSTTSIEHYIPQQQYQDKSLPQSKHDKESLNYQNLLLSCNGDGLNKCSEKKSNIRFTINPLQKDHIRLLNYSRNGEISSFNPDIQRDLEQLKLNSNSSSLKKNRAERISLVLIKLKEKKSTNTWNKSDYQKEIDNLQAKRNGQYEPFVQAAIYFLEQKKAKAPEL